MGTHVLDVAPTANVEALRAQLSLLEGVDAEQLNLFCSGAPLEDEVSLAFLENQAVDLTIPLKVEAGEKNKKKTGRAKRRIQYVRRFVNVVETFGGRRRPPLPGRGRGTGGWDAAARRRRRSAG